MTQGTAGLILIQSGLRLQSIYESTRFYSSEIHFKCSLVLKWILAPVPGLILIKKDTMFTGCYSLSALHGCHIESQIWIKAEIAVSFCSYLNHHIGHETRFSFLPFLVWTKFAHDLAGPEKSKKKKKLLKLLHSGRKRKLFAYGIIVWK